MDGMTAQAQENRAKIAEIRCQLLHGLISYEQARTAAQPIIARINARGAEIAREYGMRHKPLSFPYLMR